MAESETMSASLDGKLKKQLRTAGNRLADPPSSDAELLLLLDQVQSCLSKVNQEPTGSMHDALSPSLRALVADNLLHDPNSDVKVAVACCLNEIFRITAPVVPYDDDELKEVFQLIVSSFANLSDLSSPSYAKRISILEMVSEIRLFVVMLDVELDTLIVEMFEHFLKEIRDYHLDTVFSTMETIMTLVLVESEDISQDLLFPILASLKCHNQEVLPIARLLGERVLESCAAKVKPYLIEAVQSLRICIDDYSPVIATICEQELSCVVDPTDRPATPDQMEPLDNANPSLKRPSNRAGVSSDHENDKALETESGNVAEEPLGYYKSIKDNAKRPRTWAADSSGHEKEKALESESGNVASSSPSESLLEEGRARMAEFEAQLVKFKVELEENQKKYADLVTARDGLKKWLHAFS